MYNYVKPNEVHGMDMAYSETFNKKALTQIGHTDVSLRKSGFAKGT